GRPDARERALLGAVEHELGRCPEQLVDLGGELASRLGLPPPGSLAEPARDARNAETADRESSREHDRGRRQERGGRTDAGGTGGDRDEDGADAPQVQTLE